TPPFVFQLVKSLLNLAPPFTCADQPRPSAIKSSPALTSPNALLCRKLSATVNGTPGLSKSTVLLLPANSSHTRPRIQASLRWPFLQLYCVPTRAPIAPRKLSPLPKLRVVPSRLTLSTSLRT